MKASSGDVRGRLVKALTERELVKRVDLLDKALVKRSQLQNEVNAIRPPSKKAFVLVDGQMQEVQAVYTPEEAKKHNEEMKQYQKKLKEATDKLANFDKTLEAAFGSEGPEKLGDAFTKLGKLLSGGGGNEAEKSEE